MRMPHYSYVADLTSLVSFHGVSPWYCRTFPSGAERTARGEANDFLRGIVRISGIGRGEHKESVGTPLGAFRWPDFWATSPGLPSSSSIWRVSGLRRANEKRVSPPGVFY